MEPIARFLQAALAVIVLHTLKAQINRGESLREQRVGVALRLEEVLSFYLRRGFVFTAPRLVIYNERR